MFPSLRDLEKRDTDADWRDIATSEPFWGVITDPRFRRAALTQEQIADFYKTGREHIDFVAAELRRIGDGLFQPRAALDFGCGTGRLTEAMAELSETAIGVDVAPGMIEEARRNGAGRAAYRIGLPDGAFDWINSYIVFQHIPPARGMPLLEQLLDRLAPGGFASLHFTIDRAQPTGLRRPLAALKAMLDRYSAPRGSVLMYDYDLTAICGQFHRRGMQRLTLVHTDHGGHYGVLILAQRPAQG